MTRNTLRRELARFARIRGKNHVRTFLGIAVVKLNIDRTDDNVRMAMHVSGHYCLATPEGLEYLRTFALEDLESLAPM